MANLVEIIIQAVDKASKNLKDITKSADDMGKQMKATGILMTAAGAAIVGTMTAVTVKWASAGQEIKELADKTGFSTEALSEFKHAADLSGTSLSGLETAIKRMQVVITDSKNATSASAKSLQTLGLSYQKLKDLTPEQQFEAIANAVADITDPTLKAAAAVDIFGRAGTDMLPMLADGSQGLEDMKKEAHDLGVVFSAEAAEKAKDFMDSITNLKTALAGLGSKIAEILAPILTKLLTKVTDIIKSVIAWTQKHPALTSAITKVTFAIGALLLAVGSFITVCVVVQRIAPLVGAAFHTMLGPIGLITLAISGLVIGITALVDHFGANARALEEVKAKTKELGDTLVSDLGTAMRQAITNATEMADKQKGAIQSVIDYIKGIQTEGMELIPEDVLAKIREIRPDLAADLDTIQNGIKDTHAAYDLLTDDITKTKIADIQLKLGNADLTDEERASLLNELGVLLSDEAKRLIEKNAPDLVGILEQQQKDIDTALATQISSWQEHWNEINKGWDGTLAYLRDTVIPEMNQAVKDGLIDQDVLDTVNQKMNDLVTSTETATAKANKAVTSPWWAALNPLLAGIGAIGTIKSKLQGFQKGGIVPGPVGSPVPILAHGGERVLAAGAVGGNNFYISEMVVREEADIYRIARELFRLQRTKESLRGI
jgi:hypothetical protein